MPQLERNRIEWLRMRRIKWNVVVSSIVLAIPLAMIFPSELLPTILGVVMIAAVATVGVCDLRRVLILKRDLRERKGE